MHDRESLTEDTTWTANDGPHVIEGHVYVEEGATLTIEPCAEVRLNPDAILDVRGGRLVAEGDAEAPILLTRNGSAPWGHVEVMWPGKATFASVVMEGGGSDYPNAGYATLLARGPFEAHVTELIEVRDLRIEGSYGPGLWRFEDAAFVEGSTSLVVTGFGEGDGSDPTFAGAVIFHEAIPSEVFITDSTIRASAGHAFLRGWTGAPLDFAGANTLEDIAGCDQTGTFDTDGSGLGGCA